MYEISIPQMTLDIFSLCDYETVPKPVVTNIDCEYYTGFVYWVTRRVALLEQEMLTLLEHLDSP